MAKQVGPIFITGTIDGVIFYKLNGVYLMRSKGDYRSGKQMRKDPRLKRTIQNADQFGVASKIVKYTYYRYLPPEVRRWGLYGELTGMVKRWLQGGKSNDEAEALLIAHMKTLVPVKKTVYPSTPELPAAQPTKPLQQQTISGIQKPKKARYLSNWNVKRNCRLHIPTTESPLSSIQPTMLSMAQPLKE